MITLAVTQIERMGPARLEVLIEPCGAELDEFCDSIFSKDGKLTLSGIEFQIMEVIRYWRAEKIEIRLWADEPTLEQLLNLQQDRHQWSPAAGVGSTPGHLLLQIPDEPAPLPMVPFKDLGTIDELT